ncbi:MAG: hypothetical protein WD273_11655 [Trueperaceae bacterium]
MSFTVIVDPEGRKPIKVAAEPKLAARSLECLSFRGCAGDRPRAVAFFARRGARSAVDHEAADDAPLVLLALLRDEF